MQNRINNNKGITLVEIIAVMVLTSILAAGLGMGIVSVTQGYFFGRENAVAVQKLNIATRRLTREIQQITFVTSATAGSVTFSSVWGNRTIGFHDNAIRLHVTGGAVADGDILLDDVTSFSLTYVDSAGGAWSDTDDITQLVGIIVAIEMPAAWGGNTTFTATVYLRYNNNTGGMI